MKNFLCILFLYLTLASAYGKNPEHCTLLNRSVSCYDLPYDQQMICLIHATDRLSHLKLSHTTEDQARQTKNILSSYRKCAVERVVDPEYHILDPEYYLQCYKIFLKAMQFNYRCNE